MSYLSARTFFASNLADTFIEGSPCFENKVHMSSECSCSNIVFLASLQWPPTAIKPHKPWWFFLFPQKRHKYDQFSLNHLCGWLRRCWGTHQIKGFNRGCSICSNGRSRWLDAHHQKHHKRPQQWLLRLPWTMGMIVLRLHITDFCVT